MRRSIFQERFNYDLIQEKPSTQSFMYAVIKAICRTLMLHRCELFVTSLQVPFPSQPFIPSTNGLHSWLQTGLKANQLPRDAETETNIDIELVANFVFAPHSCRSFDHFIDRRSREGPALHLYLTYHMRLWFIIREAAEFVHACPATCIMSYLCQHRCSSIFPQRFKGHISFPRMHTIDGSRKPKTSFAQLSMERKNKAKCFQMQHHSSPPQKTRPLARARTSFRIGDVNLPELKRYWVLLSHLCSFPLTTKNLIERDGYHKPSQTMSITDTPDPNDMYPAPAERLSLTRRPPATDTPLIELPTANPKTDRELPSLTNERVENELSTTSDTSINAESSTLI